MRKVPYHWWGEVAIDFLSVGLDCHSLHSIYFEYTELEVENMSHRRISIVT